MVLPFALSWPRGRHACLPRRLRRRQVSEFQERVPEIARRLIEIIERERQTNRRFTRALHWCVREWCCHHSLPVVAVESILHIYRRAPFGLRATPADDRTRRRPLRWDRVNPARGESVRRSLT